MKKSLKRIPKELRYLAEGGERLLQDWFQNGLLLSERIIYLENNNETEEPGVVTDVMTSKLIKSITVLEVIDNKTPIIFVINTPGGCSYNAFAIYDRMRESPCPTVACGYGEIMSAGALIIQAADVRTMSPNAMMMIHDGGLGIDDHPKSVEAGLENFKKQVKTQHEIFLQRIKKAHPEYTIKDVEKLCSYDKYFTADEAMEIGLVDHIIVASKRKYET